jgi:hypothetical protein
MNKRRPKEQNIIEVNGQMYGNATYVSVDSFFTFCRIRNEKLQANTPVTLTMRVGERVQIN